MKNLFVSRLFLFISLLVSLSPIQAAEPTTFESVKAKIMQFGDWSNQYKNRALSRIKRCFFGPIGRCRANEKAQAFAELTLVTGLAMVPLVAIMDKGKPKTKSPTIRAQSLLLKKYKKGMYEFNDKYDWDKIKKYIAYYEAENGDTYFGNIISYNSAENNFEFKQKVGIIGSRGDGIFLTATTYPAAAKVFFLTKEQFDKQQEELQEALKKADAGIPLSIKK